jgi:hypothetical protein
MHVSGRLAPEAVQRGVRSIFGRLRSCYANGLHDLPALRGRVVTLFTIGRDGVVSYASSDHSTMPDERVTSCVVRSFEGLRFPRPEGGRATVTYPIDFGEAR